ncbi:MULTISPECIES: DUF808 domain-containing protein [unclassified Methylophaga]|uniref:DUF808 domain-containing protein n=1 Tax=unclassified Methylophaga TaxID=2629249 RepID=UPI000C5CE184|nr:DUF808 domain-containing protein [Methylophaga sp. UBA678]MAX53868.1 hypothetical protein [Methylophaga sp.]|tara:strand:+ start:26823 stop:27743 length:921 start_codon:yes stop_codon:yes gene_type:complete
MASVGLLALVDDIASLLDDVSVMTKVAAKKTAGVLGDDLALNAQQVTGVDPKRELPVVWAVAKGSFLNKLILVPLALIISAVFPIGVTILLMLGGLFLCYEGMEKLAHKWLPHEESDDEHKKKLAAATADENIDIKAYERKKIKGAIRTDFILSAEIIVIALGVAQGESLLTQAIVVSLIAIVMTSGVYGLVAGIVKFDDAGLALVKAGQGDSRFDGFQRKLGQVILFLAPKLMKFLSVVGMIAMFLVGGGILVHGLPFLHHLLEGLNASMGAVMTVMMPVLFNGGVGLIAGVMVLSIVTGMKKLF